MADIDDRPSFGVYPAAVIEAKCTPCSLIFGLYTVRIPDFHGVKNHATRPYFGARTPFPRPHHCPCRRRSPRIGEACDVPPDDRFQLISRFQPDAMLLNPTFPNVSRSSGACVVKITFLRRRSEEQKHALYARVVANAASSGFAPDDIMITSTENSPNDWSLGRGQAYSAHSDAGARCHETTQSSMR